VLIRTLFVVLLFATLAETIVHGAQSLAQVTLRRQAATAAHDELVAAAASARDAIARAVQAGGDPRALQPVAPSPVPTCRLSGASGCLLTGASVIAFSSSASGSGGTTPCEGDACTIYEQGNDNVAEGRIGVTITSQIAATNGAVVEQRTAAIAFRTLLVAPYASIVGGLDGSNAMSGTTAGDDGGAAPNGTAPGTLIDVLYQNASTGATMPGNVWQPQLQNAAGSPPAWSP
jgi:hypothetical protein